MQIFQKNLQDFYLSAYLVQTHSSQLFFVLLLLWLYFIVTVWSSLSKFFQLLHFLFYSSPHFFFCNIRYFAWGVCCPVQSSVSSWMKLELYSYLYRCLHCCCSKIYYKKIKKWTWIDPMQRASPQSLASAIWKSALLLLLFEQSYYKVKGKLMYAFCIFSYCTYVVSFTLYYWVWEK